MTVAAEIRFSRRGAGLRAFRLRVLQRPAGVAALAVLTLVVLIAIFAPALTPHEPNAQVLADRLHGPSASHLLGTDDLGRDVLSRMLVATRLSLLAALEATGVAVLLGCPAGLVAGYSRGWFDAVGSRVADAVLSIPGLLLALAIVGVLGPSLSNAMIAVGVTYAPRLFRMTRAATLSVCNNAFVEAARALGVGRLRTIIGHVLPNIAGALAVELSLAASFALLAEAGLSFLGLGVQPPDASWGSMLARSTRFMDDAPLLVVAPGLAVFVVVLCINVAGEALAGACSGSKVER